MYYCIFVHIYTLIDSQPMQVEERGWTYLFNSKCKNYSTVDDGAMNFIRVLGIRFRILPTAVRGKAVGGTRDR